MFHTRCFCCVLLKLLFAFCMRTECCKLINQLAVLVNIVSFKYRHMTCYVEEKLFWSTKEDKVHLECPKASYNNVTLSCANAQPITLHKFDYPRILNVAWNYNACCAPSIFLFVVWDVYAMNSAPTAPVFPYSKMLVFFCF